MPLVGAFLWLMPWSRAGLPGLYVAGRGIAMSRTGGSRLFLLEIGTEEMPAAAVAGAMESLGAGLRETLGKAGLPPGGVKVYGTPRRMAALLAGLPDRQQDQSIQVAGPPVAAAFDASGRPTRAAEGFAPATVTEREVGPGELVTLAGYGAGLPLKVQTDALVTEAPSPAAP